jgi:hypothetical protein
MANGHKVVSRENLPVKALGLRLRHVSYDWQEQGRDVRVASGLTAGS